MTVLLLCSTAPTQQQVPGKNPGIMQPNHCSTVALHLRRCCFAIRVAIAARHCLTLLVPLHCCTCCHCPMALLSLLPRSLHHATLAAPANQLPQPAHKNSSSKSVWGSG